MEPCLTQARSQILGGFWQSSHCFVTHPPCDMSQYVQAKGPDDVKVATDHPLGAGCHSLWALVTAKQGHCAPQWVYLWSVVVLVALTPLRGGPLGGLCPCYQWPWISLC